MREEDLKKRIDALLSRADAGAEEVLTSQELLQGALSALSLAYGENSVQVQGLVREIENINRKWSGGVAARYIISITKGTLQNLRGDLDAGLVGNLQRSIMGEVLTDFIQLARNTLNEKGDDAKNVAAVLAAAAYEDTMRRLATTSGIPHHEKLADVLTALKNTGVLQGTQVGIATSYLNFRNSALHAQWERVDREAVASVLGFVEQLLIKHFS
jgi:hypothetical protein